jgi:hypothetical protein
MNHPTGYVYLLRHPTAGLYKIGRAADYRQRADLFGRVAGGLCEVVHLIETDDAPRLEAELHKTHRPTRACGEWFRLSEEAVAAVKASERVTYATLKSPRTADAAGPVVTFRPAARVAARLATAAAAIGVPADALARRIVAECLTIYERRAAKLAARGEAATSRGRLGEE